MSVAVFVSDCLPLPSLKTRAMGIPGGSVAKTWAFAVVGLVLILLWDLTSHSHTVWQNKQAAKHNRAEAQARSNGPSMAWITL